MIDESDAMASARRHLADAERPNFDERTPHHIDEAAFLLDQIIRSGTHERTIAINLGKTYGRRYVRLINVWLSTSQVCEENLVLIREVISTLLFASVYECPGLKDTQIRAVRMYWKIITEGIPHAELETMIAEELKARAAA